MHGLKKRRRRTLGGDILVAGHRLRWTLRSEPQWSNSGRGYIGMMVSVTPLGSARRELLLVFAFPRDRHGRPLSVPQRPAVGDAIVAWATEQALAVGWDPTSRGRRFVFDVPTVG